MGDINLDGDPYSPHPQACDMSSDDIQFVTSGHISGKLKETCHTTYLQAGHSELGDEFHKCAVVI